MPYSAVPQAGQSLGATRDQIRNNIQSLKDSLAINHVDLDLANVGKHKFMQMPSQAAAPATAPDELALYVKTPAGVRLFLRQPTSGTEIQMSGIDPLNAALGYTFLPGGLLMQWGKATLPGLQTYAISFDAPAYSITLTLNGTIASDSRVTWSVSGSTAADFTLQRFTSNVPVINYFYWTAIGPKA